MSIRQQKCSAPRLTHLAGLELGAGVNLVIVAPEQAAAELRES
jgi:UDPglucose--hexose-1-phosphate uridylyltransferase